MLKLIILKKFRLGFIFVIAAFIWSVYISSSTFCISDFIPNRYLFEAPEDFIKYNPSSYKPKSNGIQGGNTKQEILPPSTLTLTTEIQPELPTESSTESPSQAPTQSTKVIDQSNLLLQIYHPFLNKTENPTNLMQNAYQNLKKSNHLPLSYELPSNPPQNSTCGDVSIQFFSGLYSEQYSLNYIIDYSVSQISALLDFKRMNLSSDRLRNFKSILSSIIEPFINGQDFPDGAFDSLVSLLTQITSTQRIADKKFDSEFLISTITSSMEKINYNKPAVSLSCQYPEDNNSVTMFITIKTNFVPPIRFFSKDPVWNSWIPKFGSDDFYFQLVGPEILTTPLPYYSSESQSYTFSVNVTLNGLYYLNVYYVYKNYQGLGDQDPRDRYSFQDLIYSSTLEITKAQNFNELISKQPTLPPCQLEENFKGRWAYGQFNTGKTWVSNCSLDCVLSFDPNITFGYWTNDYSNGSVQGFQWLPYSCHTEYLERDEILTCLNGKSLLFSGDSHLRMLAAELIRIIQNDEFVDLKKRCPPSNWDEDEICSLIIENIKIVYQRNDFGSLIFDQDNEIHDLVLFNFGHWPFSEAMRNRLNWPFDAFFMHFTNLFWKLLNINSEDLKIDKNNFFWISSSAYPMKYHQPFREWRTNPRLAIVNDLTTQLLNQYQVKSIDTFIPSFTLPISLDSNHYQTLHHYHTIQLMLKNIC